MSLESCGRLNIIINSLTTTKEIGTAWPAKEVKECENNCVFIENCITLDGIQLSVFYDIRYISYDMI